MRIGVFGGTFDPVHIAHLRCAEEAREALELDRVVFIPAATPPHKRHQPIAPARHRVAMLRLAIVGNRAFQLSTIEVDRPGASYSIDTLRALRERLPSEARLVFLLGIDAFREIHTWKEYATLFALADFGVFSRPPHPKKPLRALLPVATRHRFCYGRDRQTLIHRSGSRVIYLNLTGLDISASAIRWRVQRGQSIRYLVPAPVERYIARMRLYRRGS
jgi:nicotinate-nucleotide adenylyltransferase